MSKRVATALAWLCVASIPLSLAAGLWITSLPHEGILEVERSGTPFVITAIVGFGVVGALIVSHHPRHPVGWVYCLGGASLALALPTTAYGQYADVVPGEQPWVSLIKLLSGVAFIGGFGSIMTLALLLFPTGDLPSPRWRPLIWLIGAALASALLSSWLADRDRAWGWLVAVAGVLLIIAVLASVASLFARWRAARGIERQQLKWMAASSALLAFVLLLVIVGNTVHWWPDSGLPFAAIMFALTLVPISAGIAIQRYRLYDIDVLINRTFVYGSLVAILAGLYAASIQLFKAIFVALTGDESDVAIVITTLILATTFTPIKNRLEEIAKRRFKEPDEAATETKAPPPSEPPDTVQARLDDLAERLERVEELLAARGPGR
jgi:MFS family permease